MHDNESVIRELLKAGARGYLLKTEARHHLIAAIEALAAHRPFFTAKVSEALLDSFLSRLVEASALTYRERGVSSSPRVTPTSKSPVSWILVSRLLNHTNSKHSSCLIGTPKATRRPAGTTSQSHGSSQTFNTICVALPMPSVDASIVCVLKKHSAIELQTARAVRTRVQVATRRGDVGVAERRLHLWQRGAFVDGVGAMGMP